MHPPDNPPNIFPSKGFFVFVSIFIAKKVFTKETALAPAFSTAFAISVISVTFGESFTIRGFLVKTFFTDFVEENL